MSEPDSPATRYSQSRHRQRHPISYEFADQFNFPLDDFQLRSCAEIESGKSVLVAAPTGSGKTVVGEFAVHLALAQGRKCFYTTPIKALSNQKFQDLVARHGTEKVGLLTGDNSINSEAPIVVMTTEVLRNMLYAGSATLQGLSWVVLDEVHYLADRARGAVWEEVIIHLPESVALVCLSATVSNAEEFGEWLATVRGETATILEEKRPVPLYQHVLVGRQLHDLFDHKDAAAASGFVQEGAEVNQHLIRVARDDWAATKLRDRRAPRGPKQPDRRRNIGNGRRVWIPSRMEVIARLERDDLLPAIVFIFSRIGCDAAVEQCLAGGARLTSPEEEHEIERYVDEICADLPLADRPALGFARFREALSRGVAAHHAGLLPLFKQCVEGLFVRGLIKVVFATETLALGINMPARTVVLEKLTKWNGEVHADISPGEYTQLTGRAGRRGLDVEGHAVVLWQPGLNPRELAGLASTRTYPLNSSFRPSYNMAVNLVHHFGRERARSLLELSFAQFQADRSAVALVRQVRKAEAALAGYAEAAECELGDFMTYATLREDISRAEKGARKVQRDAVRQDAVGSLRRLRAGDIIHVPAGRSSGFAVVIDPDARANEPRTQVVTMDRQARRLSLVDFPTPVESLAFLRVPKSFNPRNPSQRRDLASALRSKVGELRQEGMGPKPSRSARQSGVSAEVTRLRNQLQAHPCHQCPEREQHARWAERWHKLRRDTDVLQRRVENRTHTVSRTFDRVCQVLQELRYLSGDEVHDRGKPLMRLYSELDLVIAEGLRQGLFAGLEQAELAALLSAFVYQSRRPDEESIPPPTKAVRLRLERFGQLAAELSELERSHRLEFIRPLDWGFAAVAFHWANGAELDEVLSLTEIPAGDFVRTMKQLVDLIGQVADATDNTDLRSQARAVSRQLMRGVVAPELSAS